MLRGLTAALTVALALYSYFDIKTSLPLLTARVPTHPGQTAPVGQVISLGLYIFLILQLFLGAIFLGAPYVAPENIHFGWWCFSKYTPEQRDRILPLLKDLMALLALLVSLYFAASIALRIHSAQSQGPLLPADWLDRGARTESEGLVALAVVCGIVIYRYVGRFDELASEE
jgi:hypothetical protein